MIDHPPQQTKTGLNSVFNPFLNLVCLVCSLCLCSGFIVSQFKWRFTAGHCVVQLAPMEVKSSWAFSGGVKGGEVFTSPIFLLKFQNQNPFLQHSPLSFLHLDPRISYFLRVCCDLTSASG